MSHELDELRTELSALTDRVKQLEQPAPHGSQATPTSPAMDRDTLWALNGLRTRIAEGTADSGGEVLMAGSVELPDGTPVAWQEGATTSSLLETEWTEEAASFAALGHPVRLELLRHILSGQHSTAELAELGSLGTTGQLHHHLRQLVAAGWARQSGRGRYEVPVARVVPLLVILTGARQ